MEGRNELGASRRERKKEKGRNEPSLPIWVLLKVSWFRLNREVMSTDAGEGRANAAETKERKGRRESIVKVGGQKQLGRRNS